MLQLRASIKSRRFSSDHERLFPLSPRRTLNRLLPDSVMLRECISLRVMSSTFLAKPLHLAASPRAPQLAGELVDAPTDGGDQHAVHPPRQVAPKTSTYR